MVVVANRIPVAAGFESDFEERFRNRAGLVEGSPGFVRNAVLRPVEGNTYVVMTFWEDMASFEAWTHSPAFGEAHRNRPPKEMFAGPSQLEVHEVFSLTEAATHRD